MASLGPAMDALENASLASASNSCCTKSSVSKSVYSDCWIQSGSVTFDGGKRSSMIKVHITTIR